MKKVQRLMPLLLVLLTNLIGFGTLFFTMDTVGDTAIYYSAAVVLLVLFSYAIILFASFGDDYLFLIVSMIFTIGIIVLLRINTEAAMNQIEYFYIGMIGFFIVYIIYRKFNFWNNRKMIFAYFFISVFFLILTQLFGTYSGGAKNWISLGPITLQPSELIKVLFIFILAGLFTAPYKNESYNLLSKILSRPFTRQALIMFIAYFHLGFFVLQREWGSAVLYFLIYFTLQYIFGKGKFYLIFNMVFALFGGLAGIKAMTHIQQRISIWLDPFADSGNLGYQIVQSLYAMASGGVTGAGIGLGYPTYIPLAKNDFIFSAICEEMGMIGGIGVIFLFFMLVYRGIMISLRVTNPFNKAVAMGISAMFGYQTFIIIGGVIKFIPLTGITLPFVSAGGSSLATCFAALAILQAISGRTKELTDVIE